MKKIIAIWLSINLLLLQALPMAAQRLPVQRGPKSFKTPKIKLTTPNSVERGILLNQRIAQAAQRNMSLPLTTQHTALLTNQDYVPAARQILTHTNVQERALLLRTDFMALALTNQVNPTDIAAGVHFYRTNLAQLNKSAPLTETIADIASLGLLGEKNDGLLLLQVAQQAIGTPTEAAVTTAVARALLRLGDYKSLEKLSQSVSMQPELWNGLRDYAKQYDLPIHLLTAQRTTVDLSALQADLVDLGPINSIVVNPTIEATYLYMNAGKNPLGETPLNTAIPEKEVLPIATDTQKSEKAAVKLSAPLSALGGATYSVNHSKELAPWTVETQRLAMQAWTERTLAQQNQPRTSAFTKATQLLTRLRPIQAADGASLTQRAALYLTAFSIGLEIGTPIMASIKSALNLPLSYAILVMAASFSPYLFGSFIANWLKGIIGRKGTINTGLALMGGSFILGATALGLDGSFTAWDNPLAQYFGILATLTTAGTGAVFIHNATGPIMTEISQKASDLIRQKRGTYIELARSVGMMASFAFPFLATSMLGMDWSAPFILALPFVTASALGLNLAHLPNTKPHVLPAPKLPQSPVVDGLRKPRKALKWKNSILNNSYVRLLREEPGVGNFVGGLFTMNAVEVAFQSGFLFMIPKLAPDESSQYLFGMMQYAVAFLAGRYLAGHFLKWFPKHNISLATLLAAIGGSTALGLTHSVYGLTAALFTAELGISTAFTLSFARTAKNHETQDRITSLIMASAISCAIGPLLLTQIAEGLMKAGVMNEGNATIATLIAIPAALTFMSAKLFKNMEGGTLGSLKANLATLWTQIKAYFRR